MYDGQVIDALNAADALVQALKITMEQGFEITSRGSKTRELLNTRIKIAYPYERCFFIPGRHDNIFHKIYETLWVISGRNDVTELATYLPRAAEWADDGKHWRAGYGPRLRAYNSEDDDLGGVDQIKETLNILRADKFSRRAVMSIYDPYHDFVESKDIPCNNWIQWLIRPGSESTYTQLYMDVTQRSSDLIWGFSGINTFEWSVLHMMMAHWTDQPIGPLTYFIGSMHVYERMYERANHMIQYLDKVVDATPYVDMPVAAGFQVPFEKLDDALTMFWLDESEERTHNISRRRTTDPFLLNCLAMLRVYLNLHKDKLTVAGYLNRLPENDFMLAAVEYVERRYSDIREFMCWSDTAEAAYLKVYG